MDISMEELLKIKAKYDAMKAKRSEINKVSHPKWREKIGEEAFKEQRKIANAKYREKQKAKNI